MSEVRRCDGRCHNATKAHCDCWCGGLFHGGAGAAARQAFAETFGGEIPPEGEESRQLELDGATRWRAAITAAKAARTQEAIPA